MANFRLNLRLISILAFALLALACSPKRQFHRGARAYYGKNEKKATRIAKKFINHETYGPAAELILLDSRIKKAKYLPQLFDANTACIDLLAKYDKMPPQQAKKLRGERLGRGKVLSKQTSVQRKAINIAKRSNSVMILDSVARGIPKMTRNVDKAWFDARTLVVNNHIHTKEYSVATSIIMNHAGVVEDKNKKYLWVLRDSIWRFFQREYPLCQIDKFRADHPWHNKSSDCWHEEAKAVFCSGSIEKAIEFEEKYPFSAFDPDVLFYLLELADDGGARNLPAEKQEMLKIIRRYVNLLLMTNSCTEVDANLYRDLQTILPKMAPRLFAYALLMDATSYLHHHNESQKATDLLTLCRPYFSDTSVCFIADYEFQVNKQPRIDSCINCAGQPSLNYQAFEPANTKRYLEYGAVSYDEGMEVYFARRIAKGKVFIFRTDHQGKGWSTPVEDFTLSVNHVATPMSMTADGLQMLLKVERMLYVAQRPSLNAPWNNPIRLPLKLKGFKRAVFSPDGKVIIAELTLGKSTVTRKAKSNLYYTELLEDGSFSPFQQLGGAINTPDKEGNPYLCADGRTLYYSSEGHSTFGEADIMVSFRTGLGWKEWTKPRNLGCQVNSTDPDYAYTWVPESGRQAYYTGKNPCSKDLNILAGDIPAFARPKPTTHLRGMLLTTRGKPIGRGQMEININDGETLVRVPISEKGIYHFRVPADARKIRLYPDIIGYYVPRDTFHLFGGATEGTTFRDTFVLLNRLEVEKNLRLKYASFSADNRLNDQRVYHEMEFLNRFAGRIKAKFELRVFTDSKAKPATAQARADTLHKTLVARFQMPAARATAVGAGAADKAYVEINFTYPPKIDQSIKQQAEAEKKKQDATLTIVTYRPSKLVVQSDDDFEEVIEDGKVVRKKRPKTWVGKAWWTITFKNRREAKKEAKQAAKRKAETEEGEEEGGDEQ